MTDAEGLKPLFDSRHVRAADFLERLLAGRYRIVRVLGEGGFGRTFLAVDIGVKPERACVVKQCFPQSLLGERRELATALFAKEIRFLAGLGAHPQIPELYDTFAEGEYQYLVQAWVEGENLANWLVRIVRARESDLLDLLGQVLPVLSYIHDRQVIHRDIKPENLIRDRDGRIALVDFGAAKILTEGSLMQAGTSIGSAEYVAPEQMRGRATLASDVYGLGVTCIYLLTGVPPFDLYSHDAATWVWQGYLNRPISRQLEFVLNRMLAEAISKRYPNARAVLDDLRQLYPYAPQFAQPEPTPEPATVAPAAQPAAPNAVPEEPVESSDSTFVFDTVDALGFDLRFDAIESEPALLAIDCTPLSAALEAGNWHRANEETHRLLLEAGKAVRRTWLEGEEIDLFPCVELRAIDELWAEHSGDRFGFSVQLRIWQDLYEPTYYKFGDRLGWFRSGAWLPHQHLTYDAGAPLGHLPAIRWWYGSAVWGLRRLFRRLDACGLGASPAPRDSKRA
ncbi:serine/threonine protein kinase [Rubidibacter lacunae KORDI 51-2]|uniref:non-specific serine/threonine protein kinase n=1 Tax=Rubidibacter lacunae KORDI 51-2 TaxID=582515 RepID=U5D7Y8_9CHRO|nr:serine/threonine-protein kinase [Rubidibacter lacunae]ERN40738.1 serine/threonine protein kinase [Rubidibacter lacunae KORDI 51-2]